MSTSEEKASHGVGAMHDLSFVSAERHFFFQHTGTRCRFVDPTLAFSLPPVGCAEGQFAFDVSSALHASSIFPAPCFFFFFFWLVPKRSRVQICIVLV